MRIAVAVSGGVDSLCALLLLRRAGHEVFALHALLAPAAAAADAAHPEPPAGLDTTCRALDVPLEVVDLRAAFAREVIAPFARAYASGRTPNPCARCNRGIKFGALMDAARDRGAEALATGHYARLAPRRQGAQGPLLAMAAHAAKDQSYFLSLVPKERLARALFPLAGLSKGDCRALVDRAGLVVPLPDESHDICFAPGGVDAYREFLTRQWQALGITPPGDGPVLLYGGASPAAKAAGEPPLGGTHPPQAAPHAGRLRRIGTHAGLWRYTEGQRRGLGVAYAEPLHVLRKDSAANALIVGPRSSLGMRGCVAREVNELVPPECWPERPLVRCRYGGGLVPARVRVEAGALHIRFAESCFPSAPGQVVALYDEEGVVLAGAVVEEILA